jgi:hypothetical protein
MIPLVKKDDLLDIAWKAGTFQDNNAQTRAYTVRNFLYDPFITSLYPTGYPLVYPRPILANEGGIVTDAIKNAVMTKYGAYIKDTALIISQPVYSLNRLSSGGALNWKNTFWERSQQPSMPQYVGQSVLTLHLDNVGLQALLTHINYNIDKANQKQAYEDRLKAIEEAKLLAAEQKAEALIALEMTLGQLEAQSFSIESRLRSAETQRNNVAALTNEMKTQRMNLESQLTDLKGALLQMGPVKEQNVKLNKDLEGLTKDKATWEKKLVEVETKNSKLVESLSVAQAKVVTAQTETARIDNDIKARIAFLDDEQKKKLAAAAQKKEQGKKTRRNILVAAGVAVGVYVYTKTK